MPSVAVAEPCTGLSSIFGLELLHDDRSNAAIANVMNNDLTAAKRAISSDDSAKADYLRAVIASKEGDLETAKAQLRSAVGKDSALAEKAAKDVNLSNLFASGFKL